MREPLVANRTGVVRPAPRLRPADGGGGKLVAQALARVRGRQPAGPARHRRATPASRLHRRSHMHRREHQGGQRRGGVSRTRRVGRRGLGARAEGAPNQAHRRAQAAGDWRQGQTQHLERGRREHRGRGRREGCLRRNRRIHRLNGLNVFVSSSTLRDGFPLCAS